ncbi:MAG TPA: nitroreductase family protein [Solirubrobacteraceae bacterium]|nr:nitroreductase family protein [Solirubrobacteraceae bacterium]
MSGADTAGQPSLYRTMRCAPSTRRFTDRDVPREMLERALDAARFAPSGGNRQGWRVIVVRDPELRRRLRELYGPPWDAYMERTGGRAILRAAEAGEPTPQVAPGRVRMLRAADEYARTFDRAPVHLVVCVEVSALAITDAQLSRPSIVGGASIYPFVQNLLLALRHEGLGASFTTLLVPAEEAVRDLLAIPGGFAVAGHISVGWRAEPWPRRLSRRPVAEFTFAERFGEPW